jgi:hypothetical protein
MFRRRRHAYPKPARIGGPARFVDIERAGQATPGDAFVQGQST